MTPRLDFFSKLGVGIAHTKIRLDGNFDGESIGKGEEKNSRVIPKIGFGIDYSLTKHTTVRIEYERLFQIEQILDLDCDLASLGLKYTF